MQDTDGTEPVAEPAAAEGDAMEIAPPAAAEAHAAFDEEAATKKVKKMNSERLKTALEAAGADTVGTKSVLVEHLVAVQRAVAGGAAAPPKPLKKPALRVSTNKFETADAEKCERVRVAMRAMRQNGDDRMPWATYCKTVAHSAKFTNADAVKSWIRRGAISLKPDWVDMPVTASQAGGPFGDVPFSELSVDNCVTVENGVALSCSGKTSSIDLLGGATAFSRRFRVSDYEDSMDLAKAAALKHTQQVAARHSYYFNDAMAEMIRAPVLKGGFGTLPKDPQMHGHLSGEDGVFTHPTTGKITTEGSRRVHKDAAAARRAADALPLRARRRAREGNTKSFVETGDTSQFAYDPRAWALLAEARSLFGPDADVDGEGKVVMRDASSEDIAAPAPVQPLEPRRRAEATELRRSRGEDDAAAPAPAGRRRPAAPRRGAAAPPRRTQSAGRTGAPAPVPRPALRKPPPKEFRDVTARMNSALHRILPEVSAARCPAHPRVQLGLFDAYIPTLERVLEQARKAAMSFVGGKWIVDDEQVLVNVYRSLVREKFVLRDAFEKIYTVSLEDDAQYFVVAEMHCAVGVGLTCGYVASSLAVVPLPIAELLHDKGFHEADKLYFSRYGARVAITDLSGRAQNCAAREIAGAVIHRRLGQGDADADLERGARWRRTTTTCGGAS